jgi:sec-independent protein translocase protein TatB
MFDIGWSELLLIAVVALVVLDPKDLPVLMRKIGAFTAKARATVAYFQGMLESASLVEEQRHLQQDLGNINNQVLEMRPLEEHATVLQQATTPDFINS